MNVEFLDEVVIKVKSGDGGNGCISFRREKYIPKGGPDGGDGGKGGDIIVKANSGIYSLAHFAFKKFFEAKRGAHGRGKNCSGKDGKSLILEVPVGTVIKDEDTGEIIADLTQDGQQIVVAKGGKGGRGNQHFATATYRTPRIAEPGKPGQERRIRLILKSIADIGLIGFPNVGKSTLLAAMSRAKPKIASYPFTTLHPNLGVLSFEDRNFSIIMADIPGLIKGAHEGKGLGHRFLRHIERTNLLLFVLDITFVPKTYLVEDFEIIKEEIKKYNPALLQKPLIIAINKIDIYDTSVHRSIQQLQEYFNNKGLVSFPISAKTGQGIKELKEGIYKLWSFKKRSIITEQDISAQ